MRPFILAAAMTALLVSGSPAFADGFSLSPNPLTLKVFESADCEECRDVDTQLDKLQTELPAGMLTVEHLKRGSPDAASQFAQYQVMSMPSYIVLDMGQQPVYTMAGLIDPEQLVWELRYRLNALPPLNPPEAFRTALDPVLAEKRPVILMFWNRSDRQISDLIDTMMLVREQWKMMPPNLLSFDSQDPAVARWMTDLGFPQGPAYIIVTPEGQIFRKSTTPAQAWNLRADCISFAQRFHLPVDDIQTVLAGNKTPEPADGAIYPATMRPGEDHLPDSLMKP
jgi:hypothetical protein